MSVKAVSKERVRKKFRAGLDMPYDVVWPRVLVDETRGEAGDARPTAAASHRALLDDVVALLQPVAAKRAGRAPRKKPLDEEGVARERAAREAREAFTERVVVGTNAVVRLLERDASALACVLVARNAQPQSLICHLPALCAVKNVLLCVLEAKEASFALGKALGSKSVLTLGLRAPLAADLEAFIARIRPAVDAPTSAMTLPPGGSDVTYAKLRTAVVETTKRPLRGVARRASKDKAAKSEERKEARREKAKAEQKRRRLSKRRRKRLAAATD